MLLGMPVPDDVEVKIVHPLILQEEVGAGPSAWAFYDNNLIWITDPDNYGLIAHEFAHIALSKTTLRNSPWHGDLPYWVHGQYWPQCGLLNVSSPESGK